LPFWFFHDSKTCRRKGPGLESTVDRFVGFG